MEGLSFIRLENAGITRNQLRSCAARVGKKRKTGRYPRPDRRFLQTNGSSLTRRWATVTMGISNVERTVGIAN